MIINSESIIKSIREVNKFYNIELYNNVVEYFKNYEIKNIINENEYELIGIIIYLFLNKDKYKVGIVINSIPKQNTIIRKLTMDNKILKNFFYSLLSNDFIINYNLIQKSEKYDIYICIDTKNLKYNDYQIIPKNINLASLTQLFGIENINILKYINIDRSFQLQETKEGKNSDHQMDLYKKIFLKSNEYEKYSSVVLSSMILYIIGTTTAMDIDPMIYNVMDNKEIKEIANKMSNNNIDYILLNKNNIWYWEKTKSNAYWMTYAISEEWVKSVGASNIQELFFNSKYHFYFNNIKFTSLELEISRLFKRNSPFAYVDLYALKKFNYPTLKLECKMPQLRKRCGRITCIDINTYKKTIKKIKTFLYDWHKIDVTIKELENTFMCDEINPYNKYLKNVNTANLFDNLRKYHQYIKSYYLEKYCKNINILLDVGSAHLKSLKFWKKYNIKHIISLEPSKDLYNFGSKVIERNDFAKKRVKYIRAVGEKDWLSGNAGLNNDSKKMLINLKKIKADVITFEFSLHYMLYNIDSLMKNINNFSKRNTYVIIHCINGNLIEENMTKNDKISVYHNKEEVFYIKKQYKNSDEYKKVDIYFKGAQGLNNVVTEYVIYPNYLINKFIEYDFKLIEFTKFLDHEYFKFNLQDYEIQVSNNYVTYVFCKN
jgi:hypothetical protein